MQLQSCVLCGETALDVKLALIAWRDPDEGHPFDASPRCRDEDACRVRVERQGEAWPVRDRKPVRA